MKKRKIKEVQYDISLIIIGSIAGLLLSISGSAIYSFSLERLRSHDFSDNVSNVILIVIPFAFAIVLFRDLFKSLDEGSKK